jgi:4-amino-4-deoxy-L-arabinose transferase-like glycosyltransferase
LALPALLLSAVALLPFLDKPFTIDDTVFLSEARHAVSDPLHPTAFSMNWDHAYERLSAIVPTGPVMAWLLVPSIMAGGEEWIAHAVGLVALWLAIVATVSLALRSGLSPRWAAGAGLLLASTPTALAMAGTAMPDVPAMALGVAGLERLVAWREERRWHQGVVAAILLGLAPMTRSHLVLLFGVGVLLLVRDPFSWIDWRRGPWTRWLPIAAAAFVAIAVAIGTRDPEPGGGDLASAAAHFTSLWSVASNAIAFPTHFVLTSAFGLGWTALRWRAIVKRYWVVIAGAVLAAFLLDQTYAVGIQYAVAPVFTLAVAALVDVLIDAWRRRDGLQLALGAWLLVPLPVVIYVQMPSKYLLASAPAAALLLARAMAERPALGRRAFAMATVLGAALGVAILSADSAMAEVGREGARRLIAPQVAAGRRIWYVGHWGFQWYAEKAGARCWSTEPPYPMEGDLIASDWISAYTLVKDLEVLTHLARVEKTQPGLRIMSREQGVGFYTNHWGYLPLIWGDGPVDAVDLWLAVRRGESSSGGSLTSVR